MSIKEHDLEVQTTTQLSPQAYMLMSDGAEIEIHVSDTGVDGAEAWAEWRGQHWSAAGDTKDIAMRMLIERLHRRDPSLSDG